MLAGAGRIEITPTYAVELAGFFGRCQPAAGVHDPIFVRCLVFQNERPSGPGDQDSKSPAKRVVILSCELCELERSLAERIRRRLSESFRIRPEHILIACTHTHSAPAAYPFRGGGRPEPRFGHDLEERAEQCVGRALANLRPVQFGLGTGLLHIAHNRRARLRRRREAIGNPAEPIAEGPYDPLLRVMALRDEQDRLVALLLGYSCHPVCFRGENRLISGDYCGLACAALEHRLGADSVVLFLNGPAGDINPRPEFGTGSHAALAVAQAMVAETKRVLGSLAFQPSDRLQGRLATEPLPTAEAAATYRARLQDLQARLDAAAMSGPDSPQTALLRAQRDHYAELCAQLEQGRLPGFLPAIVQRLSFGPVDLLALSGEVFVEIGQRIRNLAGRDDLWLAAYSNGGFGYVPTQEAFREGGYEPDESCWFYGQPALAAGAGERLAEAAVRLLGES